jgi:tetratricopeptide (TPR) repeat protein
MEKNKTKYMKIEVSEGRGSKVTTEDGSKPSIESAKYNFEQFKSTNDSLYLARTYYEKGNYSKAQKWALTTNNLDNKLEESWFIFAKSKAKRGQKKEAIEILSAYIKKTNSAKAKELLNNIKKGKF